VEYITTVGEMASSAGVDEVSCQIIRVRRIARRIVGFDETEGYTTRRLPWAGFFARCVLASAAAASIGAGIRSPLSYVQPSRVSWMDSRARIALFCCTPNK